MSYLVTHCKRGIPKRDWLGLLSIVLVLSLCPQAAHAQDPSILKGKVENGTAGAPLPAKLDILLHILESDRIVEVRQTQSSPAGEFQFPNVTSRQGLAYLVSTEYLGVVYTQELTDLSQGSIAILRVHEPTTSSENIRITGNTLLVGGEKPQPGRLDILELATIENAGDRTFVPSMPPEGAMGFLRFPLPPGSQELKVSAQLPGAQTFQVDKGFALVAPVPPGVYTIGFTYYIPYSQQTFSFTRNLPFGATSFRLLYPKNVGDVRSDALRERSDPITVGEISYRVFEGKEFKPGESIDIDLLALPQKGWLDYALESPRLSALGTMGIPVILGLALVALLAFSLVARRSRSSSALASQVENETTHQDIVKSIADLDSRFQHGDMDEGRYQQERAKLKAKLISEAMSQRPRHRQA